jgi:hypothetical protein
VVPDVRRQILTPEVLIALFGLIGTLGAGLGVTFFNNQAVRQREKQQWEREIGEQRRLERLDAVEEFAALTMALTLTGKNFNSDELLRSLHRVEMRCSPSTGDVAIDLYADSLTLMRELEKPEEARDREEYDRKEKKYAESRKRFRDLAREEIRSASTESRGTQARLVSREEERGISSPPEDPQRSAQEEQEGDPDEGQDLRHQST